ncbi:MAG: hypothetical protein FJ295_03525 [Planctomycetes bacterium]|nr:hypothetical protein [Planctomycetota bacterium]
METVLLLVVILLVILFFVGFWPASRTWKWYHLLFLSFVMLSSFWYLAMASMSLKTRAFWGELYVKTLKDLNTAKEKNEELIQGTPQMLKEDEMATQPAAKGAVDRLLVGRGRVFRNCAIQGIVDQGPEKGNVLVRVPLAPAVPPAPNPAQPGVVPPAAADPAAEGRAHGIQEHTIVYLFSEKVEEGFSVPDAYLGEFDVFATSPDAVSLKRTLPGDPLQDQILVTRAASVTVYERIPTDSHYAFEDFLKFRNGGQPPNAEQEQMVNGIIRYLIKRPADVTEEAYEKTILQFLRDGKAVQPDDPPDRIYARVRFKKPYEMEVDSPNKEQRLDSEYFDLSGLAVQSDLRRSEKAKFVAGDLALLPLQAADQLTNEDICEKLETVYRRPLQDFKFHYHEIFSRLVDMDIRIEFLSRLISDTDQIQKKLQAQVDYRTRELMRLQQDLVGHKADLAAITEYEERIRTELETVRNRIAGFEESNQKLFDDIALLQSQMADEIIRNTQQAANERAAK